MTIHFQQKIQEIREYDPMWVRRVVAIYRDGEKTPFFEDRFDKVPNDQDMIKAALEKDPTIQIFTIKIFAKGKTLLSCRMNKQGIALNDNETPCPVPPKPVVHQLTKRHTHEALAILNDISELTCVYIKAYLETFPCAERTREKSSFCVNCRAKSLLKEIDDERR